MALSSPAPGKPLSLSSVFGHLCSAGVKVTVVRRYCVALIMLYRIQTSRYIHLWAKRPMERRIEMRTPPAVL